jgi:predicted AAA+ superfamily ATPase
MRTAAATLKKLASRHRVVAITGPRQSGKTMLARECFPDKPYVSLDDLNHWLTAHDDPNGFLARYPEGAIIDEAQRVLGLISPLREHVEGKSNPSLFILVGTHPLGLALNINESMGGLAGRQQLLPLSLEELRTLGGIPPSLDELLWHGCLPALADTKRSPAEYFNHYILDLLERDISKAISLRDTTLFMQFMKLCAARTAQLLNLSALANDCGISHVTAAGWIGLLEDLGLVLRLPPYPKGFGKRVVKTPKLHFLDPGLAAWLADIRDPAMLNLHPLRGALFESWVVSEFVKARRHRGLPDRLYFWRDNIGNEIDLLYEEAGRLQPIEIKAGATPTEDWFRANARWHRFAGPAAKPTLFVYGGPTNHQHDKTQLVSWPELDAITNARSADQ